MEQQPEEVDLDQIDELKLRKQLAKEKEIKSTPIKFNEVLQETKDDRFVILGAPGSGKSTLLRYMALAFAQNEFKSWLKLENRYLPVLIEIRNFEKKLADTKKDDYNILDYLYDFYRQDYSICLPHGFFEKYLKMGEILLLFDGLDEVGEETQRLNVKDKIHAFINLYSNGNLIIITSRIAGYNRTRFSVEIYRHFTLLDFDDDEIKEFVDKWYKSRLDNETEALRLANDLFNTMQIKKQILELAHNPLLLTIIGIIHRYETELPEDRLELYDKATESLLYTWDKWRDIIDERFTRVQRRQFLEKVGFEIQSLEKGEASGTLLPKQNLCKILVPDFEKIFSCDPAEAEEKALDFVELIRQRSGLVVELAPGQFGFVHKTFQEYFAAKFMANQTIRQFNLGIMKDYIERFLNNPFWQETLLLALRALPAEQTRLLLESILKRNGFGAEDILYHDHYFVVKFLAEQSRWLQDEDFVSATMSNFLAWSLENRNRDKYYNYSWNRAKDYTNQVTDVLASRSIKNWLLNLAEDEKQESDLRRDCAEAVGQLGFKDKAVDILLKLAEDEKQEDGLRGYCAYAVGQMGFKDKAVVDRLLKLAEDEKQEDGLRGICAEAVSQLVLKDKTVVDRLLKLAEDEKQEDDLRGSCAEAVGQLGFKDKAVEILVKMYRQKEEKYVWEILWRLTNV